LTTALPIRSTLCLLLTAFCLLSSSVAARLRPPVLRLLALRGLHRRLRGRRGGLNRRALDLLRRVARLRLAVVYGRVGRGDGLRPLRVRVLRLRHGALRLGDRLGLAARGYPGGEAAEEGARLETFVAECLRRTG